MKGTRDRPVLQPVPVKIVDGWMSVLDRNKEDELLDSVSHSSEAPQGMEKVLRLRPMKCRCRRCHCLCDDVKFGELRSAVPSKGFLKEGGKMFEENEISLLIIISSYNLSLVEKHFVES